MMVIAGMFLGRSMVALATAIMISTNANCHELGFSFVLSADDSADGIEALQAIAELLLRRIISVFATDWE